jgi:adenine-specific DNA-methyltransferase
MTVEPARFERRPEGEAVVGGVRAQSDRRLMGAVYTPDLLARWVASMLRDHSAHPIRRVLDPACGDGALLDAASAEIPELQSVVGIDLSANATSKIQASWGKRATTVVADTLRVMASAAPEADAVIMNPPWGAELNVSRDELRELGYELATGQYDSWDLFVEWSVKAMPTGTTIAAILPDAIFLPEHEAARHLLLKRTRLHTVARLGEGWFKGVFRGVAVIVYTIGAVEDGEVQCIRLPYDVRRQIRDGQSTFSEAVERIETVSRQGTWAADPRAQFMSAGSAVTARNIRHIEARAGEWTHWVTAGRGVEIGKFGGLVRCGWCGVHRQPPRVGQPTCGTCGHASSWEVAKAISLQMPRNLEGWVPLIVGEDVRRYNASPSRWLRVGLKGVQYKDEALFRGPKLLVRKTGLGLNASFDTTGSFTTQVVFHYTLRGHAPEFVLEYLEGVLCSRVLLAVHLSQTGETEWRSHPYVTPTVLSNLPIPTPEPGSPDWRQAQAIAQAARNVRSAAIEHRAEAECMVDRLVAGLYGLDQAGCGWVDSVLAGTQSLQAFSHLRTHAASRLVAERAA